MTHSPSRASNITSSLAVQALQGQAMSVESMQLALHELHVHQIELEVQNENLRQAHVALDASAAQYVELYDLAPVGYLTVNDTGLMVRTNRMAAALLGMAPARLIGQAIKDVIARNDQDIFYLLRKKALETGMSQSQDLQLIKPDGTLFWAHLIATEAKNEDGMAELRVVVTDITDRKCAEFALAESEANLAHAFDASPIGMSLVAPNGRFIKINRSFSLLVGWSEADLLKVDFQAITHPLDLDADMALLEELVEGCRQTYQMDKRYLHKDGHIIWVQLNVSLVKDAQGAPLHMVSQIQDISERRQAESARQAHALELQSLSRRVLEAQETERRRIAIELHDELGQSLTAIKINLQAHARFKDRTPEDLNLENLHMVEDALQQVRRLAQTLRPSILDDLGLAPALRWMAEQTAARSGFAVTFFAARLQGRLAAEIETAIFRIAQEALTNVARYAQAQQVDINLHREDDTLLFTLTDDGSGFDPAEVKVRAAAGGSIGMLGMQERAVLLGGHLDIAAAPGQGCTVRLRCPLRLRGAAA